MRNNFLLYNLVVGGISTPVLLKDTDAKKGILDALKKFNEKYCKQPNKKELNSAKSKLELLLHELRMHLSEKFMQCKNIEYTGSSYEGLKLSGDGLEFDAMFIFTGGEKLRVVPVKGEDGFAELEVSDTDAERSYLEKYVDEGKNIISSSKMKDKFKGALQDFISSNSKYKDILKMKEHGPAIQFDYKEKKDEILFSVDLLLSFEIQVEGKTGM